jgi:hypothetical protein
MIESIFASSGLSLTALTVVFVLGYEWLLYRVSHRRGLPTELTERIAKLYGELRLPEPTKSEASAAN